MPEFARTTKEKRHEHIAYLRENGTGATSVDRKHSHELIYRQPQEALIVGPEDPRYLEYANGEVPAVEGGWIVSSDNDHTHDILEFEPKDEAPEKKLTDEERVKRVRALREEAREEEKDFRSQGNKAEGFYSGDAQWDDDDKKKMEAKNRPALTINEIEPKIDLLSGYHRQNRMDIKYFPVEGGDGKVADILTIAVKNILEQSNFEDEENEVFEDEMIVGRGLFNIYASYDRNIRGEIIVEQFAWDECSFGPHRKADLSDCEYLTKEKWQSFARIEQEWPDKADEIGKSVKDLLSFGKDDEFLKENKEEPYKDDGKSTPAPLTLDAKYTNIARKEFLTIELREKTYHHMHVIVGTADEFYYGAEGWGKKDIKAVKTIPGLTVIPMVKTRIKITQEAGGVILEHHEDDILEDMFCVIPVYAKKRKKKIWGKVKPVMDMQKEVNKRHSQFTDILSKMAAYGWFYDNKTFASKQEEKQFRNNSATPGFTAKLKDTSRPPLKVEGSKLPTEIVAMEAMSSDKIRELMNINAELLGQESTAESGVALLRKQTQGLVGNEFLFDNLSLAKRLLGRALVKFIKKLYTPERLYRLLKDRSASQQFNIGGEDFNKLEEEAVLTLLNEDDLTKYDVVVGESGHSPTIRQANFLIWMEARNFGMIVPEEFLLDLSDLPDKEKAKQMFKQAMEQKQAEDQATRDTEIQKTLIAKSPPEAPPGGGPAR